MTPLSPSWRGFSIKFRIRVRRPDRVQATRRLSSRCSASSRRRDLCVVRPLRGVQSGRLYFGVGRPANMPNCGAVFSNGGAAPRSSLRTPCNALPPLGGFQTLSGRCARSIQSALFHPPAESSVSGWGRRLEILAVHQVTAPNDSTSAVDQGPTVFTKAIVASQFSF
jgi:hypothetical protein